RRESSRGPERQRPAHALQGSETDAHRRIREGLPLAPPLSHGRQPLARRGARGHRAALPPRPFPQARAPVRRIAPPPPTMHHELAARLLGLQRVVWERPPAGTLRRGVVPVPLVP